MAASGESLPIIRTTPAGSSVRQEIPCARAFAAPCGRCHRPGAARRFRHMAARCRRSFSPGIRRRISSLYGKISPLRQDHPHTPAGSPALHPAQRPRPGHLPVGSSEPPRASGGVFPMRLPRCAGAGSCVAVRGLCPAPEPFAGRRCRKAERSAAGQGTALLSVPARPESPPGNLLGHGAGQVRKSRLCRKRDQRKGQPVCRLHQPGRHNIRQISARPLMQTPDSPQRSAVGSRASTAC